VKKFLVGGFVRDKLLGIPSNDRDWVVVGETPESMLSKGFASVGKDFPVFLDSFGEEHALARQERSTGKGHQAFSFTTDNVTIEEDLERRDFRFNSIAMTEDDQYIDPYGGIQDIHDKIIRHTSDAFREDPLRVLRCARFASRFHKLGFTIAPETMQLMSDMVADGELDHLTAERVWQEIEKTLKGPSPRIFFEVLRECGALKVLIPELDALWGVPQTAVHHPEIDTGIHTMMVLDMAEKLSINPATRFAALVHDLGKGNTPKEILPKHHGHEERSVVLVEQVCDRLKVPNDFRIMAKHVAEYHTTVHRALEIRPQTMLELFQRTNAFAKTELFHQMLIACEADARGRLNFENREYPQVQFLKDALEVVRVVDAQQYIEKGFVGKQIGDMIHQERVLRLKTFKDTCSVS